MHYYKALKSRSKSFFFPPPEDKSKFSSALSWLGYLAGWVKIKNINKNCDCCPQSLFQEIKIVVNSGFQSSELQSVSQMSQVCKIVLCRNCERTMHIAAHNSKCRTDRKKKILLPVARKYGLYLHSGGRRQGMPLIFFVKNNFFFNI